MLLPFVYDDHAHDVERPGAVAGGAACLDSHGHATGHAGCPSFRA